MAEQKPRASRARKKASEADAVTTKAAAKKASEVDAVTTKAAAKKKTAATPARKRATVSLAIAPGDVAVRAYYLWEQGEPGDATEHWLQAEQQLAAA